MRRIILSLFILFIACSLSAQIKMGLKGPAAKNYKPWKEKTVQLKAANHTSVVIDRPQGPAAKNSKPWKNMNPGEAIGNDVNTKTLVIRKGPAAKNYKPWKKTKVRYSEDQSNIVLLNEEK